MNNNIYRNLFGGFYKSAIWYLYSKTHRNDLGSKIVNSKPKIKKPGQIKTF